MDEYSSMGFFHVFYIVKMVPNRAKRHILIVPYFQLWLEIWRTKWIFYKLGSFLKAKKITEVTWDNFFLDDFGDYNEFKSLNFFHWVFFLLLCLWFESQLCIIFGYKFSLKSSENHRRSRRSLIRLNLLNTRNFGRIPCITNF